MKESLKKAQTRYRSKFKRYEIKVSRDKDANVIEYLSGRNVNAYVLSLLRKAARKKAEGK